jgi:tRNA threonylcarbamoyladenosine biosynthesis protein TsaB
MRLLAVDTTTRWAGAALLDGGDVRGEVRLREDGGHSATVLPAVEALLGFLGLVPSDIDVFAAAVGPGSFTGVRVGVSTVQGLALAAGRPCVGVSTLEALAAKMRGASATLVPLVDAYREDQVFAARYDGDLVEQEAPACVVPRDLLDRLPAGAAFLGDGALRHRGLIRERRPDAVFPERSLFLAAAVGLVAERRFAAGAAVEAAALRPLYLRAADIRPKSVPPAEPGR